MRHVRLIRGLGFLDSVLLGIGFIVGSGIYIMPVLAAQKAGSWSLFGWIAAGLYTLLAGLCFAELAFRIPKSGGLYAYAHQVFGDFWGFLTGYTFWLGYCITIAVETLALAWYLSFFTDAPFEFRLAVSGSVAVLFTLINYHGIGAGGKTEDALTVAKLIPLAALAVAGLVFFNPSAFSSGFSTLAGADVLPAILSSVILALWAYQGVEIITVPEEEIKNAKKTVPRAIMVAVLSVMGVYLLVALAVLGSPWQDFASSQTPLADLAGSLFGGWFSPLVAVGGLASILGALNAVILAAARISYAMARDGLFPEYFSHLSEKHETPDMALVFQLLLAGGMLLIFRDFVFLASVAVLFTLTPWLFSCLAALKIERKDRRPSLFKNKYIPFAASAVTLGLIAYLLPTHGIYGAAALAPGLAYYFFRAKSGTEEKLKKGSTGANRARRPLRRRKRRKTR